VAAIGYINPKKEYEQAISGLRPVELSVLNAPFGNATPLASVVAAMCRPAGYPMLLIYVAERRLVLCHS
jgi:hypothetical protein